MQKQASNNVGEYSKINNELKQTEQTHARQFDDTKLYKLLTYEKRDIICHIFTRRSTVHRETSNHIPLIGWYQFGGILKWISLILYTHEIKILYMWLIPMNIVLKIVIIKELNFNNHTLLERKWLKGEWLKPHVYEAAYSNKQETSVWITSFEHVFAFTYFWID